MGARLIILNFHGVGPVSPSTPAAERDCWLDQEFFQAALDLVEGQAHVQLTFDDGNASDAEIVMPALLRRGLSATFFVCSGRLGHPAFLSPARLPELLAHGMRIGSHGVAHVSWRHLPAPRLWDEVAGSRQALEQVCGVPVDIAACPFGAYDRAVLGGLRRAGYRQVCTSDGGVSAENHWLQPRTTVTRGMRLEDIRRLVRRGPGLWRQCSIHARKLVKRLR
jgi:peptidoglycan/xylan/chitin deacetylase (PgdA/CDA1 family)